MKEFVLDFIKLDINKISTKFTQFFMRNHIKIRTTSSHLWKELKVIGKGFVTFKDDIKESVTDVKDLHYARYK